jgi:predicted nucleotidyltransferase
MDVSHPYSALSSTLDGVVLNALAGTTRPLTGREVSRLAGRKSHAGARDVLNRLVVHGLVSRQEAGRALLYTLNRDHLAAPAVLLLAGLREELLSRLRETIAKWDIAPVHASLFGSAARGDGGTSSDIDLLLIRAPGIAAEDARWRQQLDDLAASVLSWTGNRLSIAEVAGGDVRRVNEADGSILREMDENAVLLAGGELRMVLRGAR